MQIKTVVLLILSSIFNAALSGFSFIAAFLTSSPTSNDIAYVIIFYVSNLIAIVAFFSIFTPWILAYKRRTKSAIITSLCRL